MGKSAKLYNGAIVNAYSAIITYTNICNVVHKRIYSICDKQYIEINFALANQIIYDLLKKAQNPEYNIATVVKQSMINSNFLDCNGQMNDDIKNVVLSTIILAPITNSFLKYEHFYINNPIIELVELEDIKTVGKVSEDALPI